MLLLFDGYSPPTDSLPTQGLVEGVFAWFLMLIRAWDTAHYRS